jgi:secreted trypsin-like serine protease
MFSDVMARGVNLVPEEFYSDPTFVENALSLINRDFFILGGIKAEGFPDCVAVGPKSFTKPSDLCCSGTLIALNAVLTARHCAGGCGWKVFVGDDTSKITSDKMYEVVPPRVPYEEHSGLHDNDLALLFLKTNVEGVTPRQRAESYMIDKAKSIRVAGFGSTEPGEGAGGSGKRLMADMTLASNACTGFAPNNFKCHENLEMVAIEFYKADSCETDSGGPAYVEHDGQWYLAGINSRHVKTSKECGSGSIYVRVDRYRKWIDKELQNRPPK